MGRGREEAADDLYRRRHTDLVAGRRIKDVHGDGASDVSGGQLRGVYRGGGKAGQLKPGKASDLESLWKQSDIH